MTRSGSKHLPGWTHPEQPDTAPVAGEVGPGSVAAPGSAVGRWAMALVIGVCSVIAAWRLLGSFAFINDDIVQFETAARTGFSSDLLLMNMAQHFAPINRAVHYLLYELTGANPMAGALLATLMIATLLVVTAWLTHELGLSLVRRLLIVAATGLALPVLDAAVWSDAAIHMLLALIATYMVVAAHLRGIRTDSWSWHFASVALFAVGLLTQERAAFALPLVVVIDVFLLWRDEWIGDRFRRLLAVKWPLLSMTVIGVVAAWWIRQNYAGTGSSPSPIATVRAGLLALTGYQFPQLVGHQPEESLGALAQLVALVVILLVCYVLIAANKRNAGPVLFFFVVFAMYWGFLVFSPMLSTAAIEANASRLQNAVYLVVPGYLAVFSLEAPHGLSAAFRARVNERARSVIGFVAVGLLMVWMTIAGSSYTADNWAGYRSAHAFWQGAVDSRSQWTDPAVTVVPLQIPASVANTWAVIFGRQEFLLPLLSPGWRPADLTARPVVLNPSGEVQDAALQVVSQTVPDPAIAAGGCVTPESYLTAYQFGLASTVEAGPVLARLRYTSDTGGAVRATPTTAAGQLQTGWPVGVGDGTHEVLLPLTIDQPTGFQLDYLSPGSTFCINSIDIVRPLLIRPDGTCQVIDQYGAATGVQSACPGKP